MTLEELAADYKLRQAEDDEDYEEVEVDLEQWETATGLLDKCLKIFDRLGNREPEKPLSKRFKKEIAALSDEVYEFMNTAPEG